MICASLGPGGVDVSSDHELSVQERVSRDTLSAVREFLGGPDQDSEGWTFEFGEHLESNWGAVYGGALAAGTLSVARSIAPDRAPRSLHLQIVRSVLRGRAFATAKMRQSGRTVGTVEVDLYDQRQKLAAVALLTMVTPDAVAADHHDTAATPPFRLTAGPLAHPEQQQAWSAPVVEALNLMSRRDGNPVLLRAENVRPSLDGSMAVASECTVPWDNLELTGPESACLVADSIVAAPVLASSLPPELIGPNPDLTLRFTTAPATRVITAAGMLLSVQRGTTMIGIEVQAGDQQLAHGLATSLLLRPRSGLAK
jgi:acyl-coenzyme A thioesterase PaaI-like protein